MDYKAETTLNEKDSLQDMLNLEKNLVKVYSTAMTEGASDGFRTLIKEHCPSVNYLIYFVIDSIEILDLSKIDSLLKESFIYKNVKSGRLINSQPHISIIL